MKLKLELMQMTKKNMADVVTCIGVAAILSVIVFTIPNEIPIGEMAYQKLWLGRMAVVFVVCQSVVSLPEQETISVFSGDSNMGIDCIGRN